MSRSCVRHWMRLIYWRVQMMEELKDAEHTQHPSLSPLQLTKKVEGSVASFLLMESAGCDPQATEASRLVASTTVSPPSSSSSSSSSPTTFLLQQYQHPQQQQHNSKEKDDDKVSSSWTSLLLSSISDQGSPMKVSPKFAGHSPVRWPVCQTPPTTRIIDHNTSNGDNFNVNDYNDDHQKVMSDERSFTSCLLEFPSYIMDTFHQFSSSSSSLSHTCSYSSSSSFPSPTHLNHFSTVMNKLITQHRQEMTTTNQHPFNPKSYCNIHVVMCLLVILIMSMCQPLAGASDHFSTFNRSNVTNNTDNTTRTVNLNVTTNIRTIRLNSPPFRSESARSNVHAPNIRSNQRPSPLSSKVNHRSTADPSIVQYFITPNVSINFTHIVLDTRGDRIYAAASNWLYQFSASDLDNPSFSLPTGPVLDSSLCSPSDCSGVDSPIPTANINKVLVIDEYSSKLIVCGSVHQGACRRHSLENISDHEPLIPIPVAANDENSSTYAFIGPSKYYGRPVTPVLYVGATNSRSGPYRENVPAISSRSLEKGPRLFSVVENSLSDIALVDIESHLKDYYLVKYIYGFYTQDFIYFATVQKKSHHRSLEEWGYVTRLARVCAQDAAYNTYTEVTLSCIGHDGTDYTLLQDAVTVRAGRSLANDLDIPVGASVLIGTFSTSKDHTWKPSDRSAICIYSVEAIEQKFNENIHLCYNGSAVTRNMDYIAGNIKDCPEPGRGGNVVSFCSETLKLNGSVPIIGQPAITFTNATLTAVTGAIVGPHNVAFVGTSRGHLKKILLSKVHRGEQFEEMIIDHGNPILSDMHIDRTEQYLYLASPYKLAKVSIQRCNEYSSCGQCLQARNPYCGWCSLEKRCTLKSTCTKTSNASSNSNSNNNGLWLSMDAQQCIDFQSIKPESLPITSAATVELVINKLPKLSPPARYMCVFGDGPAMDASVIPSGLSCQLPPMNRRPQIPADRDHVVVGLSVRSTETQTDFLHRQYIFYDCSAHRTCRECIQSNWNCNWCLNENTCMSDSNRSSCPATSSNTVHKQPNDRTFPARPSAYTSSRLITDPHKCPSLLVMDDGGSSTRDISVPESGEILIPNGIPQSISLPVKNLPQPTSNGYNCLFTVEDRSYSTPAKVHDGGTRIVCAETVHKYNADQSTIQATLAITLNRDSFIDKINITLYKCSILGSHNGRSDCSLCATRNRKYQCQWCGTDGVGGGECQFSGTCGDAPTTRSMCPAPRIDWIHPLSGPIEGGTLVAIEGSNLGTNRAEIENKITIGGVPCRVVEYNVSVRVVCQTGPISQPMAADIVVGNRVGFTQAQEKFRYLPIILTDNYPKYGPKSGGTRLYLSGNNLNIGSSLQVFLDDLPCSVDRILASSNHITCRTSAAPSSSYKVSKLWVKIDHARVSLDYPFVYTEDPSIIKISPLKSFIGGGRMMTVTGTNLTSIQQPRMAVFDPNGVVLSETVCKVLSNTRMNCPSPPVDPLLLAMMNTEPQLSTKINVGISPPPPTNINGNGLNNNPTNNNGKSSDYQASSYYPPQSSSGSSTSGGSKSGSNSGQNHYDSDHREIALRIGFIMDEVVAVRELSQSSPKVHSDLVYVLNPEFTPFSSGSNGRSGVGEEVKLFTGEALIIEGRRLRLSTTESEINVTVGNTPCNLTSLTHSQLICIPPESQPAGTDEHGRRTANDLPMVVIRVGSNLRYQLGYLKYNGEDEGNSFDLPPIVIGALAVGGILLLLFIVPIFRYFFFRFFYQHHPHHHRHSHRGREPNHPYHHPAHLRHLPPHPHHITSLSSAHPLFSPSPHHHPYTIPAQKLYAEIQEPIVFTDFGTGRSRKYDTIKYDDPNR
ncbi:plexin-B-like isoform X2 [Brevipalpus obovatus]|uniref:plexin-B-like isoform X2 n=1 Tax=Brevipalpus obovatus TaxID=246614 RepID=UPI003D9EC3B1